MAKGDTRTAIKRFNQAWLLTPDDGGVYWGFGVALGQQLQFDQSITMFTKSLELAPKNGRLLCDFAHTYAGKGIQKNISNEDKMLCFEKAIKLCQEASQLEPKYERAYSQWAAVLYYQENYADAWKMIHKAQALNRNSVDERLLKDLTLKMSDPIER